jgi:putative transposase
LLLIVTDGCAGLKAAIETVYPRALHQRCWVHKIRNILEHVRKRDHDEVKRDAQAIYGAESRPQAVAAFRAFRRRWQRHYAPMVRGWSAICRNCFLFSAFPGICGRSCVPPMSSSAVSSRCVAGLGPWSAFVNVASVDRIIYSIFQRFNLEWKTRTLKLFTQAA